MTLGRGEKKGASGLLDCVSLDSPNCFEISSITRWIGRHQNWNLCYLLSTNVLEVNSARKSVEFLRKSKVDVHLGSTIQSCFSRKTKVISGLRLTPFVERTLCLLSDRPSSKVAGREFDGGMGKKSKPPETFSRGYVHSSDVQSIPVANQLQRSRHV